MRASIADRRNPCILEQSRPGHRPGAEDDDPSGIATYTVVGAQYGTALLWTALFTLALMIAVQTMCARIGMVTGQGIAAILGTTISPYLFFWQASQEVEEEKALGRRRIADRVGAQAYEITTRKIDIAAGTFFSNAAMFFIILATALTLHRAGITKPETSAEVAQALTPLAGRFASLLYTVGLLGTGLLAIPTLAGVTVPMGASAASAYSINDRLRASHRGSWRRDR